MAALAYRHHDHRNVSRQTDLFARNFSARNFSAKNFSAKNVSAKNVSAENVSAENLFAEDEPLQAARELPMRSTAGLGERRFTAWRGRSGRRYVASIFAIGDGHALGFTDAVLLAVSGDRRILAARDSGPFGIEAALTRWQQAIAQAGASEIHVHLLAEDGISRRAALLDLMPEV